MGVYVYKTTRKSVNVKGLGKVHIAAFVYKPSSFSFATEAILCAKHIHPTIRAWERAGEEPEYIAFADLNDKGKPMPGSGIYKSNQLSFYDDYFDPPIVGYLKRISARRWECVKEEDDAYNNSFS